MNTESTVTESVVRNHLQAFLEQKGVAAIVADYDDAARFYSEATIYRGKQQIGDFFADFIDALPAGGIDRFTLRSMRVDGDIAHITWSVGSEIPLGTDTFVVENGKIVSQTFAMYAGPGADGEGGAAGHDDRSRAERGVDQDRRTDAGLDRRLLPTTSFDN